MRICIDTNAYSAFKRGDRDVVEVVRHADLIGVSVVVIGELLAGFAVGQRAEPNRRELDAFLNAARVRVLGLDEETAGNYAAVYRQLRRKGRPIPTSDLWIAAGALQGGYRLLTLDAHFAEIEGLLAGTRLDHFIP